MFIPLGFLQFLFSFFFYSWNIIYLCVDFFLLSFLFFFHVGHYFWKNFKPLLFQICLLFFSLFPSGISIIHMSFYYYPPFLNTLHELFFCHFRVSISLFSLITVLAYSLLFPLEPFMCYSYFKFFIQ